LLDQERETMRHIRHRTNLYDTVAASALQVLTRRLITLPKCRRVAQIRGHGPRSGVEPRRCCRRPTDPATRSRRPEGAQLPRAKPRASPTGVPPPASCPAFNARRYR
jgi:hypothetical protein